MEEEETMLSTPLDMGTRGAIRKSASAHILRMACGKEGAGAKGALGRQCAQITADAFEQRHATRRLAAVVGNKFVPHKPEGGCVFSCAICWEGVYRCLLIQDEL